MSDERRQITISSVEALLEQGMNRAEIKDELGLSHSGMKTLFAHPKLKGRKPHKQPDFIIVDDTEADVQEAPTVDAQAGPDYHTDFDAQTEEDAHAGADQTL